MDFNRASRTKKEQHTSSMGVEKNIGEAVKENTR